MTVLFWGCCEHKFIQCAPWLWLPRRREPAVWRRQWLALLATTPCRKPPEPNGLSVRTVATSTTASRRNDHPRTEELDRTIHPDSPTWGTILWVFHCYSHHTSWQCIGYQHCDLSWDRLHNYKVCFLKIVSPSPLSQFMLGAAMTPTFV